MRFLSALVVAFFALAAPLDASTITYDVTLAPEATGATGSGTGTVIYDDVAHTLDISTTWSGLSGVTTVAHIHCCVTTAGTGTVGVAVTPNTLPGFPTGVTSGSYSVVIDLTQSASYTGTFLAANGNTAEGAETALFAGMNAGQAYLNIHSSTFGAGEIRGFLIVPEPATAVLLLGALPLALRIRRRRSSASR